MPPDAGSDATDIGMYGVWEPDVLQQLQLEQIFPEGVCDFAQPDAGLPMGW